MKITLPIAILASAISAGVAFPAEPILIGDGRAEISQRSITDLQELARRVVGESASPWMLHCDKYLSGPQTGHVFRVWVYLAPRSKSDRLIRGNCIFCIDQTMQNSWYPESPVVGGWSTTDRQSKEYALVAPPKQTFGVRGPWTKPFTVSGRISDQDVVALADIMHQTFADREVTSLIGSDATHVRASAYREPGEFLEVDFEKAEDEWHEIKRTRLVE